MQFRQEHCAYILVTIKVLRASVVVALGAAQNQPIFELHLDGVAGGLSNILFSSRHL
jgi:hypothetical protein